ncbi:probable WRKY transcription factor 50 [Daucus carota subsp. sativus]|uniref:probable WRKY transcription factor 50 n=1 Tax=Daucus carota subsp. sativus TaxID=79200 RepID=UPI0007B1970F|nr:PREDICTED: probable WRKY transcription factor 50 [Daucus carota subsp. sativus]
MDDTGFRSFESSRSDNYGSFEFSELLEFDEWAEADPGVMVSGYPVDPVYAAANDGRSIVGGSSNVEASNARGNIGSRAARKEKVAFRTMTEIEILDDGFKWRKYGKKMVKNSPMPRNYYRCSIEGCAVKKRVERDREDPRYVITTYEGQHNHQANML